MDETNLLLNTKAKSNDLSLIFAIICIVDVFGVFPVIALPKSVIECGFLGILIVTVVCSVQIYTACLLGKCWVIAEEVDLSIKDKKRYPYAALAEITYGNAFSNFVSFLLNVTIFCGGIPNLIVASQNLELLGQRLSSADISFCYWIILIGMILCPVLWLGSPKDMKFLCSLSVALVLIVFFLVSGCLLFSSANTTLEPNNEPEQSLWQLIFISYGVISFQYDIHPTILSIQVDMREKFKLNSAVLGAFAISLGMFLVVTIIAAVKFGTDTKPSLLETLPTTIPLHFAALFVALQLCLSLAISNSALFQHMEDCMSIPKAFNQRRCILRTTLTLTAILIAESVPRFDLVMSLIGGTLTGPLIFILPPMFYLRMLSIQKRHTERLAMETFYIAADSTEEEHSFQMDLNQDTALWKRKMEVACCILIILSSVFCTLATTYVNVVNAIEFSSFSQPCIVNVSAAIINM